jgi:PAS domain S-box-containing protein
MSIKSFFKNTPNISSIDSYPDAIIIINSINEIAGWNDKAEKIFGYLENEIVGRNIAIIFDESLEKIHLSRFEHTSQILNAKTRDGKDLIAEISCNDLKKDGKTIISVKDVTKSQKVIEKLLLEYEKVSKIAATKSGFVAAHTHELKTPLHAIIGFSQGLLDGVCGSIDEKQEKYVSIINKNANSLLSLLDNMIMLSRLEAGEVHVDNKVFDISELLESLRNDIAYVLEEKSVTFEIDCSALERKTIFTDEVILRQILQNLFINAIKFTDIGEIKVKLTHPEIEMVENAGIQTVPYFTNKSYILFSVSDKGVGLSEDEKQKIFYDYNNQSGNTVIKKYGTIDLSLAITKKLTSTLGGNIWVNSNFDQGSTFSFIIPIEKILTSLMPQTEE